MLLMCCILIFFILSFIDMVYCQIILYYNVQCSLGDNKQCFTTTSLYRTEIKDNIDVGLHLKFCID